MQENYINYFYISQFRDIASFFGALRYFNAGTVALISTRRRLVQIVQLCQYELFIYSLKFNQFNK